MDDMELAGHALAHGGAKKPKEPKPMKEMHVKELHDKTYHIAKHSGKMGEPPEEGSAKDIDGVHDHVHSHFGGVEGEAKKDEGKGEKAGGEGETAESKPGGGQGQAADHKEK